MPAFEQAVVKALKTLPKGYWQRVDGLMTESVVMKLYPTYFSRLRLWIMERRGIIESCRSNNSFWRSQNGMKSYKLAGR